MSELVGPNEKYKIDNLWSSPPFSHLSGIANHWAQAYSDQKGNLTFPLEIAEIDNKTFRVHKADGKPVDTQKEAEELLKEIQRLNKSNPPSYQHDYKVGQTPTGKWEVYWERESPYDTEEIEDIKARYGDNIVSLFELDRHGLNFTHSAGRGRDEPNNLKGRLAINRIDNAVIALVEMVHDNDFNHLLIPKLKVAQAGLIGEATTLWSKFIHSLGERGYHGFEMNNQTNLFVHAQAPGSSTNFFVAEFDGLFQDH